MSAIRDADRLNSVPARVVWNLVTKDGWNMSNRVLLGLALALAAATALAEAPDTLRPAIRIGDSDWSLFRPAPTQPATYDIGYLMDGLRCDRPGYALRFEPNAAFSLDLHISPMTGRDDFIGPVYDMDIGATRLVLSFNF